jgi:hypothetical protein
MYPYVLEGFPGSSALPHRPTDYQHILLLLVVIEDSYGRYLLLRTLLYDDEEHQTGDSPGEAFWTLPSHVLRKVDHSGPPPTTVRAMQDILDSYRARGRSMDTAAKNLAFELGLNDPEVETLGPPLTLLKPSIRNSEQWLAIRFHSYLAWTQVQAGRRNLADPEGSLGLVHLPLDNLDSIIVRRRREEEWEQWWYGGKPIAPEIQYLLAPERRGKLLEHPVRLGPEHFHRDDEGLILVADLAGWGTALREAKKMRAVGVDGHHSVARLLESTTAAFYGLIDRVGPAYVQDTGDGINAVFPRRVFDLEEVLRRLEHGWLELLGQVEDLNGYLRKQGVAIGSRLVLHYGEYRYGRIGQARSRGPAVRGMRIVEAARLEQGLANYLLEKGGGGVITRADRGWRHMLAVSDAALERCGVELERFTQGLKSEGRQLLRAKESTLHGHIWHVDV